MPSVANNLLCECEQIHVLFLPKYKRQNEQQFRLERRGPTLKR